jgi:hypothetical protein
VAAYEQMDTTPATSISNTTCTTEPFFIS